LARHGPVYDDSYRDIRRVKDPFAPSNLCLLVSMYMTSVPRAQRFWLQWLLALALCACSASAFAADPARVEWSPSFARFRTSEAVFTGALLLPIAGALFLYPDVERHFQGGILFDDPVRNALALGSRAGRARAASYSDKFYYALGAYPLVIDTALVTWGIHGAGDVALQMLGINLEAYALTGAVTLNGLKLGRARPAERSCRGDPDYSPKCDNDLALNQSFPSGHSAIAFTSAGLMCAHHSHLPLYGGGAGDVAACVVGLAGATTTGVLRIMSDNHYASDVLFGTALGLFSGYIMPSWLHYGFGSARATNTGTLLPVLRTGGPAPMLAVLAPRFDARYAGLTLVGAY
jgi:membrane-associated phospholipid phosphatase